MGIPSFGIRIVNGRRMLDTWRMGALGWTKFGTLLHWTHTEPFGVTFLERGQVYATVLNWGVGAGTEFPLASNGWWHFVDQQPEGVSLGGFWGTPYWSKNEGWLY